MSIEVSGCSCMIARRCFQRQGYQMCTYRMRERDDDDFFRNLWVDDSTRLRELVFDCPRGQDCCGMECCPRGGYGYDDGDHYNRGGRRRGRGGFPWWAALYVHALVVAALSC